jgi:hypothetical protein
MAAIEKTERQRARDELAARIFEAIITGTLASGKGIGSDGTPEAHHAFRFADAFLKVQSENGG